MAHAWVAACDAGDMRIVELLLPVVEHTELGVNCADRAGVTGLMAALEKGRLEVVDRLMDHGDINMDLTKTDIRGRSALDMAILSSSSHFMDLILEGLASKLEKEGELEKMLLPRLLSCVTLDKVEKFKNVLDFFNIHFQEGALLSFLIVSGEIKFIWTLLKHWHGTNTERMVITEQNKKSLLYALRAGKYNVLQPLFRNFTSIANFVENLLHTPLLNPGSLGSADRVEDRVGSLPPDRVEAVKKEIFRVVRGMIKFGCSRSFKPDIFEIAIGCIDVNVTDSNNSTLLMLAVKSAFFAEKSSVKSTFLPAIKMLLAEETLQVNSVNKFGISALDMVNTDDIVIPFLERQAVFKDVNLRKIKMPLLVSALKESRLDLASSLLDSSGTYHPSPSELATARDKLVVVLHYASEKRTLLKLLHKLEVKQGVQ